MGDFRRQPSKVWWSNYEDEALSMYSGFLGWGKGVDLSGNFSEVYPNNTSMTDKSQTVLNKTPGSFVKSERPKPVAEEEEVEEDDEDKENDGQTGSKSLESDRGSSSSPSQGSHKSQDSGFSDSEMQNNGLSLSPQCSPEMPARLSCIKCKSRDESDFQQQQQADLSQKEKSYNETVANYRKLKTSVKTTSVSTPYKLVDFNTNSCKEGEKKCLETAFDGLDESLNRSRSPVSKFGSPKETTEAGVLKSQVPRTKCDKINKIQNQLELSFKLPKKINLPQNLKIANFFHGKSSEETRVATPMARPTAKSAESIPPFRPVSCVLPGETQVSKASLDNEGFKVPKLPVEQNNTKSTNHLYDITTEIEGPPISCSTPKSSKFNYPGPSPVPRATKATEKKSISKTTFATVRKLKGLSEGKLKRPKTLIASFNR
ncbi:hypothetical protein RUM43_006405 [Polyplax serrata]|uniref:Uncharacterized protein n=1 Tax=Polyplax serrata TaxID=468196 RepID=A0AAN8PBD6_POLSC